jgi:hypothetical protein
LVFSALLGKPKVPLLRRSAPEELKPPGAGAPIVALVELDIVRDERAALKKV